MLLFDIKISANIAENPIKVSSLFRGYILRYD